MAEIQRDARGYFLPGVSGNPSGRPKLKATITGEVIDLLTVNPQIAREIAEGWLTACKNRDMRALQELLDRTEGRVASDVNIRGLIVHIGDDYAKEGLEAVKRDFLERQERYLLPEGMGKSNEKDS